MKHFKDFVSLSSTDSEDSIEKSIWYSKFEYPLVIPSIQNLLKRKLIFWKFHNFGETSGTHLVEISVSKTKLYVLIIEKKGHHEVPHLIELWVQ